MGAPCGIVQQAGGLYQPQAGGRRAAVQRLQEFEEFLAKTGDAGGGQFGKAAGLDQRITAAQAVWHLFIKHAFADAVGGDIYFLWFEHLDQLAQHFAGQRHQFHPFQPGAGALAQVGDIAGRDPIHRFKHGLRRHAVFMQNGQRIAFAFHIQPGDGPPGAANQINPVMPPAEFSLEPGKHADDVALAPIDAARDLLKAEGPQGRGGTLAHGALPDHGQFHRRAADIADQTLCLGPAQQHALCRQARLFRAIDHEHAQAGFAQHFLREIGTIGGFAHGGGGDNRQRGKRHAVGQQRKAFHGFQRPFAPKRIQLTGFGKTRAKAAHDLFVVEIGRGPGGTIKHHKPHRV